MRLFLPWLSTNLIAFLAAQASAREPAFEAPLVIPDVPRALAVQAGDLDGDGRLDLAAAGGPGKVHVLLQDPADRERWEHVSLAVGTGSYFVRPADFDADGLADLAVADPATAAYFVRSRGGGSFANPAVLPQTRASRWIAAGDWTGDGLLDLASANHDANTVSVLAGDGAGGFTVLQEFGGDDAHAAEALDHDGDGRLDLALGVGTGGTVIRLNAGGRLGNARPDAALGCVRYMAAADFDRDGKGDLVATCDTGRLISVGISQGNGSHKRTLSFASPEREVTAAAGDLDGDGVQDVAAVAAGRAGLAVHLGLADGTFLSSPRLFGHPGKGSLFFIAPDLDGEGRRDVVSADVYSSTLSVFWGRGGERFLEAGQVVGSVTPASALALADLDRDGRLDVFFAAAVQPRVLVHLDPIHEPLSTPIAIATQATYGSLEVLDLDGDGTLDLSGTSSPSSALVALLDPGGAIRKELKLEAGLSPSVVRGGDFDRDGLVDLAVLCADSNEVALLLGKGGGELAAAESVPTLQGPRRLVLEDLDSDGRIDLAVSSSAAIAVHFGLPGGAFSATELVLQSANIDAAAGDLDGDATPDLAFITVGADAAAAVLRGKGGGRFEDPLLFPTGLKGPSAISLADADRDGVLDVTASNGLGESAAMLFSDGPGRFSDPRVLRVGPVDLGHRLADVDLDGALDIAAFSRGAATILLGRPGAASRPFRRGDADLDGKVAITDAIILLEWLFRGGAQPACPDAADADDDGAHSLTDAVRGLLWLFRGGDPPPAPGPELCGLDPTPDGLAACQGACE
ncbi:MAG: VCBS repeat-containing protein [Planctomycetes bacterium]|nr:VCBS repeat-containing protein [Planctomycetota bacterium]